MATIGKRPGLITPSGTKRHCWVVFLLVLLTGGHLLVAADPPSPAETAALLQKAQTAALTAEECAKLTLALGEKSQVGYWVRIGETLYANSAVAKRHAAAVLLRKKWLDRQDELAGLSLAEVGALQEAFHRLAVREYARTLPVAWMKVNQQWRQFEVADLVALAGMLGESMRDRFPPPSTERDWGRSVAADQIWTTHLSQQVSSGPISSADYLRLAEVAGRWLSDERKAHVAGQLKASFAVESDGLVSLPIDTVASLASALSDLGDELGGPHLLSAWMAGGGQWRNASPGPLAKLAAGLGSGDSLSVKAQRETLASHALSAYLNPAATPSGAASSELISLAQGVAGALSYDQGNSLAEGMVKHLAGTQPAALKLTILDLWRAVTVLETLPGGRQGELISSWMTAGGRWQAMQVGELAMFARSLARATSAASAQHRAAVAGHIVAKYLSLEEGVKLLEIKRLIWVARSVEPILNDQQKATLAAHVWSKCLQPGSSTKDIPVPALTELVKFCRPFLSDQQKTALAASLTARVQGDPAKDPAAFVALAKYMADNGLTGEGKGNLDFAAALASALVSGMEPGGAYRCWMVALPLGTAESRAVVETQLTDSEGVVRLNVARVLAWAYNEYVGADVFAQQVDQRIASEQSTGDQRTGWLIVRGYVEAGRTGEYEPRAGKKWLDQALAEATSQQMRVVVLSELARYFEDIEDCGGAVSLLESVKAQFTGDALAAVNVMIDRLRGEHEAALAKEAARKNANQLSQKRARLGYFKRRLAIHEAKGNKDVAARLRVAIAALEEELQDAGE